METRSAEPSGSGTARTSATMGRIHAASPPSRARARASIRGEPSTSVATRRLAGRGPRAPSRARRARRQVNHPAPAERPGDLGGRAERRASSPQLPIVGACAPVEPRHHRVPDDRLVGTRPRARCRSPPRDAARQGVLAGHPGARHDELGLAHLPEGSTLRRATTRWSSPAGAGVEVQVTSSVPPSSRTTHRRSASPPPPGPAPRAGRASPRCSGRRAWRGARRRSRGPRRRRARRSRSVCAAPPAGGRRPALSLPRSPGECIRARATPAVTRGSGGCPR